MAWENLKTDYTDAVWEGRKKYRQINNSDGTVSFEDVTVYENEENSFFGAKDANQMNGAMNDIIGMLDDGVFEYAQAGGVLTGQGINGKFKADGTAEYSQFTIGEKTYGVRMGEETVIALLADGWYMFILDDSNNTINFVGTGGAGNAKLTINLVASDGIVLNNVPVTIKDRFTGETITSFTYNGQPVVVKLKVGTPYAIVGGDVLTYKTPTPVEGVVYEVMSLNVNYQKGVRYGYRRDISNSDPDGRITYLFDAVGKTPAYVNISGDGSFIPGDWGEFINEVATPVMLNNDGTEAYELDRNDQTKRADGNTSDVDNINFAGNAMVRFEKFKWVKRYTEGNYQYVIFSDIRYDNSYHAYAHTDRAGNVKERMYYSMFHGSNKNSTLRSIAGQTIMTDQTRNTEVAYAQANGEGWYTIYNSGWQFIADLLALISKSDNSQAKFGYGRCASGNSSKIATGTLKNKPGFWGSSNQTSDVKVFWVEGAWGNVWQGMAGLILSANKFLTKMTPPYNFDGNGYTVTGLSAPAEGYVKSGNLDDLSGFVPMVTGGAADTYQCDYFYKNTADIRYALVGGNWTDGLDCGSRYCLLYNAPSDTYSAVGSRLSYIPPAV